jgi:hypothetical protein
MVFSSKKTSQIFYSKVEITKSRYLGSISRFYFFFFFKERKIDINKKIKIFYFEIL